MSPRPESQISRPDAGNPTMRDSGPARLVSLDAFRGFIMIILALEGFNFARTAKQLGYGPGASVHTWTGTIWQTLAFHTSHSEWNSQFYGIGCSFWDLIMPAFLFMVGVAMPYSYAKRRRQGDSFARRFKHAAIRSAVLIWLGVLIHSQGSSQLVFFFTNVLSVIGLGYLFVFLALEAGVRVQIAVLAAVLVGYWVLFVAYPVPGAGYDFASAGSNPDWVLPGFFAHWIKNANAAAAFDRWFLNLFPRPRPFRFRPEGYVVLGFVPAIATMLFGVLTGELLRSERSPAEKLRQIVVWGVVCLLLGAAAGYTVCPVIKRLWTSSFTLLTGGWVLLMFALFYWVIELRGRRRWTYPFVVVGMNSIVIYLMSTLMHSWIARMLKVHFGQKIFDGPYGPTIEAVAVFIVLWLICWWLCRQKIFVRI